MQARFDNELVSIAALNVATWRAMVATAEATTPKVFFEAPHVVSGMQVRVRPKKDRKPLIVIEEGKWQVCQVRLEAIDPDPKVAESKAVPIFQEIGKLFAQNSLAKEALYEARDKLFREKLNIA
eukprot:15440168-Alexandrium_andersonii.AAC.1